MIPIRSLVPPTVEAIVDASGAFRVETYYPDGILKEGITTNTRSNYLAVLQKLGPV